MEASPIRELTDARAMRALAHPLRLRLLELLGHEGALTATEAGERIDESPASCSFHLRQLAKYGFVEEAPAKAGGRRRPWRRTHIRLHFGDSHEDSETAAAARALERLLRDRNLVRAQRGLDERLAEAPEWRSALGASDFTLYLTADELRALDDEIVAILRRYDERIAEPARRPAGSRPVELLVMAYAQRPGDA